MRKIIIAVILAGTSAVSVGVTTPRVSAKGAFSASTRALPPGECSSSEAPKTAISRHPAGQGKSGLVRSWSAPIGWQVFISNGVVVSLGTGSDGYGCIRAFSAGTGRTLWSYSHPAYPVVGGVIMTHGLVVASIGHAIGLGHVAGQERLVALRLTTGRLMWHVALDNRQQGMPAVVHHNLVVVSNANGTLRAYGLWKGIYKWTRPAPSGCPAPGGFVSSGLGDQSTPTLIGGNPAIVVARSCNHGSHTWVQGINPRSGAAMWTWKSSMGWGANQEVTTEVSGGDGAVAVTLRPAGIEHPARWQAVHPSYTSGFHMAVHGHGKTVMVVLDARTGRPGWQMRDVGQTPIVVGGGGTICVEASVAIECRDATTGRWEWRLNTSWAPQNYSPTDLPFVSDGMLWTVQPSGPSWSIEGFDLSSGSLLIRRDMPSARTTHHLPPSVTAVGRSMLLVSPEIQETARAIAFRIRG